MPDDQPASPTPGEPGLWHVVADTPGGPTRWEWHPADGPASAGVPTAPASLSFDNAVARTGPRRRPLPPAVLALLALAAIAAGGLLISIAMGGDDDDAAVQATASPAPTSSPAASPIPSPAAPAWEPTALAKLTAIDPTLTTDTDQAMKRAKNSCKVAEGADYASAVEQVRLRFIGVEPATAERIYDVLRSDFCPHFGTAQNLPTPPA